ncbi:MAG: hypothetical protein HYZ72_19410 [Deltaproteobacteria bacterium]|nr:hypothetical protein [Deltaproteobacteria bacterium]
MGDTLHRFWFTGWGFDWLYDTLFVQPFLWIARVNKNDFIDTVYNGTAWLSQLSHRLLRRTQTGRIRWYARVMAAGSVLIVALVLFS